MELIEICSQLVVGRDTGLGESWTGYSYLRQRRVHYDAVPRADVSHIRWNTDGNAGVVFTFVVVTLRERTACHLLQEYNVWSTFCWCSARNSRHKA